MTFLETGRLRLRNVQPKDADIIFDYRNNEACAKFQRGQTRDPAGIRALIGKRQQDELGIYAPCMIAVALKETDSLIGEIVVMPNEGTISLGYTFSYTVHRQGYAFEALSALLAHLHGQYPQWDFVSFTEAENIPSRNLLKKLGYEDLGYLPAEDSQVYGKYLRADTAEEIAQAVRG